MVSVKQILQLQNTLSSVESREMIRREGMIRRTVTSDRDAMFGEGVYLNKMDPEEFEKDVIAKNNWGQYGYRKNP